MRLGIPQSKLDANLMRRRNPAHKTLIGGIISADGELPIPKFRYREILMWSNNDRQYQFLMIGLVLKCVVIKNGGAKKSRGVAANHFA